MTEKFCTKSWSKIVSHDTAADKSGSILSSGIVYETTGASGRPGSDIPTTHGWGSNTAAKKAMNSLPTLITFGTYLFIIYLTLL